MDRAKNKVDGQIVKCVQINFRKYVRENFAYGDSKMRTACTQLRTVGNTAGGLRPQKSAQLATVQPGKVARN